METRDLVFAMKDFTADGDSDADGDDSPQSASPGINVIAQSLSGSKPMSLFGSDDPSDLLLDYNSKFATSEPALFRDEVIFQTMSACIGKNKPNALLVGPAGTGKTKIVEEIARRIANRDETVPPQLANATVYELPIGNLVAGASVVGELEERVTSIIGSLEEQDCILFIDEIHMLASRDQIYDKISQILKPALARGGLRVIGATTSQEARNLAEDPAFARRFTRIIVDELTREQTVTVLDAARPGLVAHYGNKVLLDQSTLEDVVAIADRFSQPGLHRPDNALTLLDRSCADALMDYTRKKAALAKQDPAMAAAMPPAAPVTGKRIKKTALALMTGHAAKESLDKDALQAAFGRLLGQDEAVASVSKMLANRDMDLFDDKQPLAILMAGPSGVGKTEMARIVAEQMTGCEPITLNMTEYSDASTVNRIIGSPAGYVGSDSNAELPFDILQTNPYQVILLDEFEKADRAVQRLFMSALEDGEMKTARGVVYDFSKAIVFATTNAGAGFATRQAIGFARTGQSADAEAAASLSAFFDPELVNRFQKVLQFNPISKETYRGIVAEKYAEAKREALSKKPKLQLPDEMPQTELDRIVDETYVREFGARPAMRAVRNWIQEHV